MGCAGFALLELLEPARRALSVSPKQECLTLLAWYREFLEHNEFDSDGPGAHDSRAVARLSAVTDTIHM
jgi:hypothetical protein